MGARTVATIATTAATATATIVLALTLAAQVPAVGGARGGASKYSAVLDDLSRTELVALIGELKADLKGCRAAASATATGEDGEDGTCPEGGCDNSGAAGGGIAVADDEYVDYDEVYPGLWTGPDASSYELVPLSEISLPSQAKTEEILKFNAVRDAALSKAMTAEDEELKVQGYKRNEFNQFISDQLGLDRRSRDTRPPQCIHERHPPIELMPSVSVIVVFHNEARSTLLRTAWSVLHKTPPSLVKEIILVDDGSNFEHLGQELDDEVAGIPKTRVHRLNERVGLIQAKIYGVENSTGDALVFLDSHCEVNDGWLEPLLERIMLNPRAVALPVIDSIEANTFEHREAIVEMGVWSFSMHFYWLPPAQTKHDVEMKITNTFPSPIMAGGIFAIGREFFIQSGTYDPGQDTWGGENFEMSFRIWMCGGVLESVPCSHIGHVFRTKTPYTFKNRDPFKTIAHNLNRVAEVWMDEPYRSIYYNISGNKVKAKVGDVAERKQLRMDLKCKSFDWYMKKISTFMFIPLPGNYVVEGLLRNEHAQECIYHEGNPDGNKILAVLRTCKGPNDEGPKAMHWYLTKYPEYGELRHVDGYGARCLLPLQPIKNNVRLELARCWDNELGDGRLKWNYNQETKMIHLGNFPTGCLTASSTSPDQVVVSKCKQGNKRQQWTFDPRP